ncbi:pyridoxamine 5'-phosphate oxidase family protein [Bacillus xiapuensis]|uniref:pyridoxamine 5'-phosphate oxidase family protein n=1 Tax=Bacillus xiapuensis TaxID=2014075 RepID=UPI000C2497D1|nr:pyridoxamine 5'-phosphate oxidase family protein [Bacillus xiapuensis]
MNKEQIMQKIKQVLDEQPVGTLATVKKNKPHTRYMTFFHDELTLYSPTGKDTYKVEEIEENPNVHILLGYSGNGYGDAFLEIEGTAVITSSSDLKQKLWNGELSKWFKSPEDPNFVVLKITPSVIRYMNDGKETPQVIEL